MSSGTARLRSCSAAWATAAAGCRRRLDIVQAAREPGDPRADLLGLGAPERGDLGLARRRVKGDGGQLERALQRAGLGLDVLDAADRHERAPDDEGAVLDVDLLLADLIAPAAEAERRQDEDRDERDGEH